jgi:hypothetical protein
MIEEVALKIKVSVRWSKLNGEAAQTIMSTLRNSRTGSLIYYDLSEGGIVTKPVCYGTGTKRTYVLYDDDLKAQRFSSLTVSFICTQPWGSRHITRRYTRLKDKSA